MKATAADLSPAGLTSAEVAERVARGAINDVPQGPSRTTKEIVRANVVTRFNILLGALLVVVVFVAPIQDALFGIVLIVNTAIGIVQELRAKATLERLALLSAPRARVVRDGRVQEIAIGEVVLDDLVEVRPGDQIVVDGEVVESRDLEIDESLLTGESDPVPKEPGDECLSGSFAVAGLGRYRAVRVGKEAYAARLADEARRFTLVRSELRSGIDWILAAVSWALVPTVILLVWSQLGATESVREALRVSVAGTVGMVPQGLVLLTSVAFAVGVVRLGKRNVLVQELPAVEGLARVDVVCFDKTGTLTRGSLSVQGLETFGHMAAEVPAALGAIGAAEPAPNATLAAIVAAFPDPGGWVAAGRVAFSSDRKWSAYTFVGMGSWVLGAPEMILPGETEVARRVAAHAADGKRVLLVARTDDVLEGQQLPATVFAEALVILGDDVRPDAAETLRYFGEQGVAAKVISGDHPRTVAAIARQVGIPGHDRVVDARQLPESQSSLADAVMAGTVFGRVSPHQKRAMVQALQASGHVVVMTGDGVNDVLALKDADIGIAIGSGSSASRAVAQLVLIEGEFNTLPGVVGEGRRVISNIERVANLFVTKTVYALVLALAVALAGRPFPFVPRHLTLVGTLTIGLPAFLLALAPSGRRARPGFVRRVLRFALPIGVLAGLATLVAYELAIAEDVSVVEARTVATIVLGAVGLFVLTLNTRPLHTWHKWLIGAMGFLLFVVFANSGWREFFELDLPPAVLVFAAIGVVALAGAVMYVGLRATGWVRQMPDLLRTPLELGEQWTWLPESWRAALAARGPRPALRRRSTVDPDAILEVIDLPGAAEPQPSDGKESSNTLSPPS